MKIAFFEIEDWEKEYLRIKIKNQKLIFLKEVLDEKTTDLVKDADIISIFIYSKINKEILNKLKKAKAIITRSTGFDHIDINECKKRKILVLNVPFYGENTVAEHTFALILTLSRKIHKSYERTIRGNFSLEGLMGFDLKGKTIGIVGLGRIGRHVARIAKGFEMNILVYDVKRNNKLQKELGFKYTTFDNLLNSKNIKLIKKGAYIINTARGGVIETEALVKALTNKDLKGAALDVLEEEGLIKEEVQLLSKNFSKKNLKNLIENH